MAVVRIITLDMDLDCTTGIVFEHHTTVLQLMRPIHSPSVLHVWPLPQSPQSNRLALVGLRYNRDVGQMVQYLAILTDTGIALADDTRNRSRSDLG